MSVSVTVYIGPSAPPVDPKLVEIVKSMHAMKDKPRPCKEDDGYANPDDYVDRMGRYYSSDFVGAYKPWVRELPFEEWLRRREIGEGKRA